MTESLYRRLLGPAYTELPMPIQEMHEVRDSLTAHGYATVERGSGLVAKVLSSVFGFPPAGNDVPLTVTFTVTEQREEWNRSFAGRRFYSTQEVGKGGRAGLLVERFGVFSFAMTVLERDRMLRLCIADGRFLGVPLPAFLLPRIEVFEHDADDRFNFHVDLGMPLVGRLVLYTGWLVPEGVRRALDRALDAAVRPTPSGLRPGRDAIAAT